LRNETQHNIIKVGSHASTQPTLIRQEINLVDQ